MGRRGRSQFGIGYSLRHTAQYVGEIPAGERRSATRQRCQGPIVLSGKWSTIGGMRRIWAILLVAVFGFSPIAPAVFASDPDSKLPPCCRRGGKHHCAMTAGQSASPSGPSLRADRCALFPDAQSIPAGQTVSLSGVAPAIFAGLLSHPAVCPRTEALCRISYSRAGQKRGPPAPLA